MTAMTLTKRVERLWLLLLLHAKICCRSSREMSQGEEENTACATLFLGRTSKGVKALRLLGRLGGTRAKVEVQEVDIARAAVWGGCGGKGGEVRLLVPRSVACQASAPCFLITLGSLQKNLLPLGGSVAGGRRAGAARGDHGLVLVEGARDAVVCAENVACRKKIGQGVVKLFLLGGIFFFKIALFKGGKRGAR